MCSDPRNDRPAESDRDDAINYDAVTCGICDRPLTPSTFAAWDAHDAFCDTCTVVSEAEFGVDTADDVPEDAEYHRPMTTGEAMRLAVEAALVGNTLLNGADEECDVCNEPRGHEPTGLINREDAVQIGGGAPEVNDGPEANEVGRGGLSRTHWRGGNASSNLSTDDEVEDETVEVAVTLSVETREPIPGLVVQSWRCDGRISGAEFRDTRRPAVRAIVHGSTKTPGKWQTSYLDDGEPTGDVQAATLAEALRELSPGQWELIEVHGTRRTEAA